MADATFRPREVKLAGKPCDIAAMGLHSCVQKFMSNAKFSKTVEDSKH